MKKYFAEYLATFMLVFCGTGAAAIDEITHGAVGHAGVSLTFGLVVMALVYALGRLSGAHMNPAVTIAFAIARHFRPADILPYVAAQVAGAFCASLLLQLLFPTSHFLGATLPSGTPMQSFVLEVMLGFMLMFVILQVVSGSKEEGWFAGTVIGAVVLLEAMFAGPISGASMNPARSLAPAVISGHTEQLWIYLTAPVIGTCAAIPIHQLLKK